MSGKKTITNRGDRATNVQANTVIINNGLSSSEAKEVSKYVFYENIQNYTKEAKKEAEDRFNLFTEKLLKRLKLLEVELAKFKDPEYQMSLFEAQKAAIKKPDSIDSLVELMTQRTKPINNSTLVVTIEEAIIILPKLTEKQLDILALTLIIRETFPRISTLEELKKFFDNEADKFFAKEYQAVDFLHLESTNCVTIPKALHLPLVTLLNESLPSLKGQFGDYFSKYAAIWDNSQLQNVRLTSFGVVLASVHIQSKTNKSSQEFLDLFFKKLPT